MESLSRLTEMDPKWVYGFEQNGHALHRQGETQAALKMYLKAMRVANLTNQTITDQLVYQRAGDCYVKLQQWEDAKVMFLLAAEDFKCAFSYFNLGKASYHLGHYAEAEKVLSVANTMDATQAETWGLLTLVLLQAKEPKFNAAY